MARFFRRPSYRWIEHIDGGFYNYSHKRFKEDSSSASSRLQSAVRETVSLHMERKLDVPNQMKGLKTQARNTRSVKAVKKVRGLVPAVGEPLILNDFILDKEHQF